MSGSWIVQMRPQFSSITQSCPTLCNPMDCSMPGLPVHHQLLELPQTHVHWVSDAIQPSHPLSSPSPLAFNLSQHQGLFQWVSSSHQAAKLLELQLQHLSFQWIFRTDFRWGLKPVMMETEVWVRWLPAEEHMESLEARRGGDNALLGFGGSVPPLASQFQTFGLQNYERINFCFLSHRAWWFVTEAPGNKSSLVGDWLQGAFKWTELRSVTLLSFLENSHQHPPPEGHAQLVACGRPSVTSCVLHIFLTLCCGGVVASAVSHSCDPRDGARARGSPRLRGQGGAFSSVLSVCGAFVTPS